MGGPRRHRVVALGGTFDTIHKGHRALFAKAFEVADHVLVGVTSDSFVQRLGKSPQHLGELRISKVRDFLSTAYPGRAFEVFALDDYFGERVFTDRVGALVVSMETTPRVKMANEIRRKRGLKPLDAIIVPMVQSQDGRPISTTRIRKGEIDGEGRVTKST